MKDAVPPDDSVTVLLVGLIGRPAGVDDAETLRIPWNKSRLVNETVAVPEVPCETA